MFDNIIGNKNVKELLNSIENPTHAYMFSGPDGVGKMLFAQEFANKFLCISENKPCYKCKSCIQFEHDNNTDFQIIDSIDGSIKIEQIRVMISKIYEKPILSNKKIYIINNADKMTVQAQNCLLKILEEPPQYVVIILIVSNDYAILNTIKSRCIKIKFDKIEDEDLKQYLEKNGQNITNDMLKMYNGSIGKAITLQGKEEKYAKIQDYINSNYKTDFVKAAKIIYEEKDEVINFLEYMNILFYNKCDKNIRYSNCINKVNEAVGKLKYNCNIEMLIDELLLDIWEELNEEYSRCAL